MAAMELGVNVRFMGVLRLRRGVCRWQVSGVQVSGVKVSGVKVLRFRSFTLRGFGTLT